MNKDLELQIKLSEKSCKLPDDKINFIIEIIDLLENFK